MGSTDTNLGVKWWTRGSRGHILKTRDDKKERPDGGQEERGEAPHGKIGRWWDER